MQSARGGQGGIKMKEKCEVDTGVLRRVNGGREWSGGAKSCLEALYMGKAGVDERDMSMDRRQHGARDARCAGMHGKDEAGHDEGNRN